MTVTPRTANRLSQVLRIGNMVRKRQMQKKYQDPATTGLSNEEIDQGIQRARDALNQDPRANGIKRWLRALVVEKDRRAMRRRGERRR